MSPHAMNTFVSDLVEMAKAVEELPQVKAELEAARHDLNTAADRIQQLELRIIDYKNKIDDQIALTRKAEADRDEAERLFLEETDRTSAFKSFVEGLFGTAGNLLKAQAPTAPVAVPSEEQVPVGGVTQIPKEITEPTYYEPHMAEQTVNVELELTEQQLSEKYPHSIYGNASMSGDPSNIDSMAIGPGQSEPLPTSEPAPTTSPSQSSVNDAGQTLSQTFKGVYAGKLYDQHPTYVSREDWLWGGGTDATYDWRRGMKVPEGIDYATAYPNASGADF